ncbi:MAG: molybdopterin-dependent oxidoreductase [Thaumarchaeota archaeon]|nr:molybdopterin-dependent oxidoreductase [Nitrososphaerota archaeon]
MSKLTRRRFAKILVGVGASTALSGFLLQTHLDQLFESIEAQPTPVQEWREEWKPTACWIGKQDCGILARVVDGRVIKLEGNPLHPRNRGTLCPKGQAQIMALYDPYRVKAPLKRVNEKGKPGEWVEISWDEALALVGERIQEVRSRDKRLLLWLKGRSKSTAFYDKAFVSASGATALHHGAFCSDAGYRAAEYTIGFNGVLHPDFRYCRYLLNWGWNLLNAGGNKLCWITFNQQFLEARSRGMKVVTLDPRKGGVGPHTDEWIPIKPGTDLAFFLALSKVLVDEGFIDRDYLKGYTNAPFLVKGDGYFLRLGGKEQIWDLNTNSAKPFDAQGVDPALEGEYDVEGIRVKPAFQLFKEHLAQYTSEWASGVCGVPAETIRRVGEELGRNAMIGSKIVLDGVELPYRPVGIAAYHVTQQELGFQACRAVIITFTLLGAIEAVGGVRSDFDRKIHGNFYALDNIEIRDPPYNIYLKDSKFFPINSNNTALIAKITQDPAKYGVNYAPEVLIIHMSNPILAYADQPTVWNWLKGFKFIVAIDTWLSETADLFADVVLPAATLEKYEGPLSVNDGYMDGVALRLPPIKPIFNTRGEIDIYIDLCERAGILYGEGGYIDSLNKALGLKDPYKLDVNRKPTSREIFDRWAKSLGITEGIEYFERQGVFVKPIPIKDLYAAAWNPPYGGIRHRLYGESLKRYQDVMREKGSPPIYWRDYTPFPTWRSPTMENSPEEYDLYLVSYKKITYKQSRSTMIPLLKEREPEQYLLMNPATARSKGIVEGEEVWVESHNAVTGETRRVKVKVAFTEGIRPDTVALSHHYGGWSHPWVKGSGPTPNTLFFTGEGYVGLTADQSFHVKVRVYKG